MKEYFKKKYISFINPEYIKFIEDKDHNLVAFSIVMPSFSNALRKANGKLFPFGLFHMLNPRKNSKEVLFYLIGVDPYYQSKGVSGIDIEDVYLGNGVSELIVMALQALLDNGDEVLIPSPDYPLWTAATSLDVES